MSTPFTLAGVDDKLAANVQSALSHVESRLIEATTSTDPFIEEVAGHLAKAGGKRFRPLIAVLASELGTPTPQTVDAAVVVELTHLATLYHDDVMDEAPRRRGTESANNRWGNTLAILTGDFLFARASEILADLGPDAVRLQAKTFERLVTGQIHETVGPQNGEDAVAHHIQVLADKTGSLIATSARFGGMFAGLSLATLDALEAFGEAVGLAFQIADDILDIASAAEISGKTPGTDLREGILTLPMLLVQKASRSEDAELLELLGRPLPDDADHARALELMRAHQGLKDAQAVAKKYAEDAIAELHAIRTLAQSDGGFADSQRVDAVLTTLEGICRSTADREV
jgi:heptaprenyl diphosphate synthase